MNTQSIGNGQTDSKITQSSRLSTYEAMVFSKRWLLAAPDKVPYYISGLKRRGELDSHEDRAQLANYDDATAALSTRGKGWLLGFALGPDGYGGYWQGIDFDDVIDNQLADLANTVPGYVEMSPSGKGAHAIGYGRQFVALGPNNSGIEAYSASRYFTVTKNRIRDDLPVCLASYVEQTLAPRHRSGRSASTHSADTGAVEIIPADDKLKAELRSALASMRSDDRDLWIRIGMALREIGEPGRALWIEWSQTSEKYDPKDAARVWNSFRPKETSHQAVFAEAARQGWLNPASNNAQLARTIDIPARPFPGSIKLEFARSSDTATLRLAYLVDPYLPSMCAVGFFGRGATAKSSFLASMAADISANASTLWVSVEEPKDWIKVRHIRSGGADGTLAVVTAVPAKKDSEGRVIASNFNIYEHLEPAILQAQREFQHDGKPPLRLVVLDTAVGLTTWGRGEGPNDDVAVKRLLANLQHLAEIYTLTVAIIGHANKGKHDHFADAVMGGTAWTNSPRLSFIHVRDQRSEHSYVIRVAKTSVDQFFAASYSTTPVHTLHERPNGANSVLCRVQLSEVVWGADPSMELYEAATRNPDEADDDEGNRKISLVQNVVLTVEEMVRNSDAPVTRDMVHAHLGRTVSGREWLKIDERLRLLTILHKVEIVAGPQNKAIYQKSV